MKTTLRSTAVALLSALTLAGVCSPANAVDLGVQAKIWPITEVDIREVVLQQMAHAHLDEQLKQTRQDAIDYVKNLPARSLPLADKTETVYFDPSIELANEINVPVKGIDGNYTWQQLYPKGYKVNPLENRVLPLAYLFFDGSNPGQRAWAAGLASDIQNRVMPIDVTGTQFSDTAKAFGRPVFYASDQLLERLHITKTPTLAYQGEGKNSLYMALTTFTEPYSPAAFHQFWPRNANAATATSNTGKK